MRGSQVRLASRRGLQAGWVCTAQAIQACRADEDCSAGRIAEQVRLVRFAEQVRLARQGVTPRLRYADARQPGGQRRRGVQYRRGSVAQRRLEQQQHEARVRPVSKPSPVRSASAALPVDGPRHADCPGSLRHALALRQASGEPACRRLSQLAFDIGCDASSSARSGKTAATCRARRASTDALLCAGLA